MLVFVFQALCVDLYRLCVCVCVCVCVCWSLQGLLVLVFVFQALCVDLYRLCVCVCVSLTLVTGFVCVCLFPYPLIMFVLDDYRSSQYCDMRML